MGISTSFWRVSQRACQLIPETFAALTGFFIEPRYGLFVAD
jgi:hypothetical protein